MHRTTINLPNGLYKKLQQIRGYRIANGESVSLTEQIIQLLEKAIEGKQSKKGKE